VLLSSNAYHLFIRASHVWKKDASPLMANA
jgi:hypothetical protein